MQDSQTQPWDPIVLLTKGGTIAWQKVSETTKTVTEAMFSGYQWIIKDSNHQSVLNFFKNFWDYEVLEQVTFNFLWAIKDWLEIMFNAELVGKALVTLKNIWNLTVISETKQKSNEKLKKMVNWLYTGTIVKPQRMLEVFGKELKAEEEEQIEAADSETNNTGSCDSMSGTSFNGITEFQIFLKGKPDMKKGECLRDVFLLWIGNGD